MVAGDDLPVGGMPTQGHGPGEVGGLRSQPEVVITHADTQRFAAVMLTDEIRGKLPVVGDHECYPVGGDGAASAVDLPRESAVAVR